MNGPHLNTEVDDLRRTYLAMSNYVGRVSCVLMMLRHLYEGREALRWLTEPQPLLNGRIPADLIETVDGMREVEALVARITEGAHS